MLELHLAQGYARASMKLVDLLEPGRIVHRLAATRREDVLHELVHRGLTPPGANTELGAADEEQIIRVLEERERLGSTGIKDGLAIPHGKLERLDRLVAALGVSEKPIDFGAMDGLPSQIFIVLLAPENAGGAHLKALARISRLFSDAAFSRRILDAKDANGLFDVVAAEDDRYG